MTLAPTAPERDKWEYDRQQNIIDQIDANGAERSADACDEGDSAIEPTLAKRKAEAQAVQNYLVKKNAVSQEAIDTVNAVDAAWIAENPAPVEKDTDDIEGPKV